MRFSTKSIVWVVSVETPGGQLAEVMNDSNANLGGAS